MFGASLKATEMYTILSSHVMKLVAFELNTPRTQFRIGCQTWNLSDFIRLDLNAGKLISY